MNRMKILRIIARLNIGGPARNAVLLTEGFSTSSASGGLRSNNIETVLVCGEVAKGEGDMMWLAREKGINPVIVPELGRELSFINDWVAFWKIYGIICREKPDIIHTHTAKAGTLGRLAGVVYNILRLLRFARNDRTVVLVHTFHGHVLHSYFGRVKSFVFIWIEKILALFTDKIITVSSNLERELSGIFRIAHEKKFSVVELGFELDGLLKMPAKSGTDCINIGIVGRLVPVKNHRMLLRALKRVKGEGCRVKLIVIGDGELRAELEAYARELGIYDIVEFRGWVKDLREVYGDLDIVVLTSLNEGTPVSLIEAMAAARPVVATRVGGVGDVVSDGKNGYLVKSGDVEGFAEKLSELIKDRDKRLKFGEEGRRSVKDRFSKDRLIKDVKELYNNILSG
ncbi:MAG: glycosyltransferase family 4 protein [Candidatus Omnitrophica bacterium]|nr:glycosyltransferase family 4 protein [Candidatus Omnitrophota bacterium]